MPARKQTQPETPIGDPFGDEPPPEQLGTGQVSTRRQQDEQASALRPIAAPTIKFLSLDKLTCDLNDVLKRASLDDRRTAIPHILQVIANAVSEFRADTIIHKAEAEFHELALKLDDPAEARRLITVVGAEAIEGKLKAAGQVVKINKAPAIPK